MKFISYFVGFSVSLLALLAIIAFLLPNNQHLEHSLEINAPAALIKPYFTESSEFIVWSSLTETDGNATVSYSGPNTGVGAKRLWASDIVGNGSLEVTEITDNRIDFDLNFGSRGAATSYILLQSNNSDSTTLTWGYDTEVGNNPINRWLGMTLEQNVAKPQQIGLNNLKREVEQRYLNDRKKIFSEESSTELDTSTDEQSESVVESDDSNSDVENSLDNTVSSDSLEQEDAVEIADE